MTRNYGGEPMRLVVLLVAFIAVGCSSCESSPAKKPTVGAVRGTADVTLERAWEGFQAVTDLQFAVTDAVTVVVLEQGGRAWRFAPDGTRRAVFFEVDVLSGGELGLLGIAFHPRFRENGRFFINHTVPGGRAALSRVVEWRVPGADMRRAPQPVRTIFELNQPYANHNAGQLQFGPDGYLYIGWGDGGSGDDPEERAQDPAEYFGKMLRIDVDRASGSTPYAVPADNPFVDRGGYRPEIWALGLRNPWRYSFDPAGRLVVADVGQSQYEEIDIVEAGKNYGWDVREGAHCHEPPAGCSAQGLTDPIFEYSHDDGRSITGGYVYLGDRVPALRGKYLFGDLNGNLWALTLPADAAGPATAQSLGRHPIMPTTFGRDPAGEVYVADYNDGVIYRFVE